MPVEEPLPGGFIAEAVRVGNTVRRTPPLNAAFVAALLRHLDRAGVDLAPRYLGTDERGRQVLGHLDGRVPWREREDEAYFSDAALTRLGRLIRALHDACASPSPAGTGPRWARAPTRPSWAAAAGCSATRTTPPGPPPGRRCPAPTWSTSCSRSSKAPGGASTRAPNGTSPGCAGCAPRARSTGCGAGRSGCSSTGPGSRPPSWPDRLIPGRCRASVRFGASSPAQASLRSSATGRRKVPPAAGPRPRRRQGDACDVPAAGHVGTGRSSARGCPRERYA